MRQREEEPGSDGPNRKPRGQMKLRRKREIVNPRQEREIANQVRTRERIGLRKAENRGSQPDWRCCDFRPVVQKYVATLKNHREDLHDTGRASTNEFEWNPSSDTMKYSMVRKWTVGLSGGKDQIAIIRASGRISRARDLNVPSSGIVGEQFIEKICRVRVNVKNVAKHEATMMMKDSSLVRRSRSVKDTTTCSLSSSFSRSSCLSKPLSSRAKSKRSVRFYLVTVIVDEDSHRCGHKCIYGDNPSLTPRPILRKISETTTMKNKNAYQLRDFQDDIDDDESKRFKAVVIRIDSLGEMWREIRLLAASKPVIASMADVAASGGYYMAMAAGVIVAEDLTLTGPIGVVTGKFNLGKLYEKIGFNKEILSRGRFAELTVAKHRPFRPDEVELFAKSAQNAYKQFRDKAAYSRSMTMEEVAQGRVWTGKEAVSRGLVDAIGGFSRAVAMAKQKANIPLGRELAFGNIVVGVDRTLQELLQDLASFDEIQARMDGVMFQKLDGVSNFGPLFTLIQDYLSSL
ncbi:unnamed protein product [Camellia sinensis]